MNQIKKEEIMHKKEKNRPAEELFGVHTQDSVTNNRTKPDADSVAVVLARSTSFAVGFCEVCGYVFGINKDGVDRLNRELGLLFQKETSFVSFDGCPDCKKSQHKRDPEIKDL